MASLTLRREDRVLKQYPLGPLVTIGRLPDNTVVIDNPAVSSHHASVFRDGDDFVVEDLQSTNGTFVNETRVFRQTLHHGDVVLVGQQKLVFEERAAGALIESDDERPISSQGETVYLNNQDHQRLLGVVLNAEARAHATRGAAAAAAPLGVLRVLAGRADESEYLLKDHTSLIGRANWTLIRLKGWFAPRVAVAITRHQLGYVATLLRGKMLINTQPMKGRHDLKDGDVLEVGGLTLVFGFRE
jgi:pSer/pThr/pTyr-binding forkhead associated (FHA) protein